MRQPSLRFSWQAPLERTDGSLITPEEENKISYRLYENDQLVVDDIGLLNFELLMENKLHGTYKYHATAVLYGLESPPSEVVIVNFIPPAAPRSFSVFWID